MSSFSLVDHCGYPVLRLTTSAIFLSRGESGPDSNNDESERIGAYRNWKCSQMQQQLAELQKRAARSSGARGAQARKELLAFEKQVEEARQRYPISPVHKLTYERLTVDGIKDRKYTNYGAVEVMPG